MFVLLSDFASL